jgi:hypothetical protein
MVILIKVVPKTLIDIWAIFFVNKLRIYKTRITIPQ